MNKVTIAEKFKLFNEYWFPVIVGELNDSHIKLAKVKGEFVWHKHDNEDEMFLVIHGELLIKLRDKDIYLKPGEFIIIPKEIERMPVAEDEVHVMLLELKTILNTGNVINSKTKTKLKKL